MANTQLDESHEYYMRLALTEARKSPPKPTNYCVGAVLVDASRSKVLSTGYTLELPGNTHAEQCCLAKFAQANDITEEEVGAALPEGTVIYTTMEPCIERLSGNVPCVDRVIRAAKIKTVYVGVKEPEKFVGSNHGEKKLLDAGIMSVHVAGMEDEILQVATAGHVQNEAAK